MEDLIKSDTNDIIRNNMNRTVNENNCKSVKMYMKNLILEKKLKRGDYNASYY